MQTIELGVREFLDLALKAGGLSAEFQPLARAAAGMAAHVGATARRPEHYQCEVAVRHVFTWQRFCLILRGRIDGVQIDGDTVTVEEIKSTYLPLASVDPLGNAYHLAQLRLYHYFAALRYAGRIIPVLTYVHPTTLEERACPMAWEVDESRLFFEALAVRLLRGEAAKASWRLTRDASLRMLPFPFTNLRPGQAELVGTVEQAIDHHRDALLEAATGIGKTMAVLYPALRKLTSAGYRRVFFLTAKTAGVEAARNALEALRASGLRLRVLYLQAKSRMCPRAGEEHAECGEGYCPYADDFFTKVERLIPALLDEEELPAERLYAIGEREQVCPFELALELSLSVDLIVCDYNYAFDPRVYLRRFFSPGLAIDSLFLVDEAHNLLPRSREMNSAILQEETLRTIAELCGDAHAGVCAALVAVHAHFAHWDRALEDEGGTLLRLDVLPAELTANLEALLECLADVLVHLPRGKQRTRLLDCFFALTPVARIASDLGPEYALYVDAAPRARLLRLLCRHPARVLHRRLERSVAAIFFSATLTPFSYYRDLFGAREGASTLALPSPFPRARRLYLHVPEVSTKFAARAATRPTVARVIHTAVRVRHGNYLAFFPSYAYLSTVWAELMMDRPTNLAIHVQKPGMTLEQQAEFLHQVSAVGGERANLGLAVMGGIFGEAVDLPGERLVGAIIIGPGLPAVGIEQELIGEYFDEERHGAGSYYAYQVPGITRVIQAAGRVFRTPEDKGVVLLIDDRFLEEPYQSLLPADWFSSEQEFSTPHYAEVLARFWAEIDEPFPGLSPG